MAGLEDLRFEPVPTRIRARLGGRVVVDSVRAVLIWAPRRLVPQYAVPESDVSAELRPSTAGEDGNATGSAVRLAQDGPMVLPSAGFGVHTVAGEPCTVLADTESRPGAGFRLSDPDLVGNVALDFAAFAGWWEEEDELASHPRDPFKRIDVRRSTRPVRIERDGRVLAETDRPRILVETHLPVRFYLPAHDVHRELLGDSDAVTACAYKGYARYLSLGEDIAWFYPEPLPDGVEVRDLICFWDERVDMIIDGRRRERPLSPWS